MAVATVSRAPSGETARRVDVDGLLVEVRRRFGPDRRLYVTYIVEAGDHRGTAYLLQRVVRRDGWQSSVYGDASGWVVRIGRSERVTRDVLVGEQRYLALLADAYDVTIRGVSVEDLEPDDPWDALAARALRGSTPAEAAIAPVAPDRRHPGTRPPARATAG